MAETRKMILREVGGNAELVANRLVRHLKTPLKANKQCAWHFDYAITTVFLLCDTTYTGESKQLGFMNTFLKEDIVRLTLRLLSFVVVDMSRTPQNQLMEEGKQIDLIQSSVLLLWCCERYSVYWALIMLRLGFLRIIADLLAFPTYLKGHTIPKLERILKDNFPAYFCYRHVILAAIKGVREITVDGVVENIQSGLLASAWMAFEKTLLARAAFNAIYERDFADEHYRQCNAVRTSSF